MHNKKRQGHEVLAAYSVGNKLVISAALVCVCVCVCVWSILNIIKKTFAAAKVRKICDMCKEKREKIVRPPAAPP